MRVIKADLHWYEARQTIPNGLLTYTLSSFGNTPYKAIKKLLKKLPWKTTPTHS